MKHLKPTLILVLSLSTILSCTDNELEPEVTQDFQSVFKTTSISEDQCLEDIIWTLGEGDPNLRRNAQYITTKFGILDLEQIIERISDPEQSASHYSIRLVTEDPTVVEFLILVSSSEGYIGYILQYIPDNIVAFATLFLENYSGQLNVLNLDRSIQATEYFEAGKQQIASSNARTNDKAKCDCKMSSTAVYGPITGTVIGHDKTILCTCDNGGGGSILGIGQLIESPTNGGGAFGGNGSSTGSGGSGSPTGKKYGGNGEKIGLELTTELIISNNVSSVEKDLDQLPSNYLRDKYVPRMTKNELNYFDNNLTPSQKIVYLKSAYRAEKTIQNLAPLSSSLHNDQYDALRHTYLHALLCKDLSIELSKTLGDLHEDFNSNPNLEKAMDLFNNQKGRDVFSLLALSTDNLTPHFVNVGLLIKSIESMKNGNLRKIKRNELVPTP
ncbi:hypothetical protein [Reichenbachiella sp. MSK19-1]|uniref:DUF6973 domain-containing protein n=1 Tax=Reichenbachiella sp. MSK19-1 TaxID=1897631 RepID=UPI000E6CCEF1|nr:hypothetical protein [Reichenbachiella sp. MSK19-1]RJE73884.1 hypothetical protein BGP76_11745 [Reichenbachiella sp. MSK19-1]